jgi:hypothetical protein
LRSLCESHSKWHLRWLLFRSTLTVPHTVFLVHELAIHIDIRNNDSLQLSDHHTYSLLVVDT